MLFKFNYAKERNVKRFKRKTNKNTDKIINDRISNFFTSLFCIHK